jgi:hypothetical protein
VVPALDFVLGFVMADARRHVRTNEPGGTRGPTFMLVRSATEVAWSVHVDVAPAIAAELDALAADELPLRARSRGGSGS